MSKTFTVDSKGVRRLQYRLKEFTERSPFEAVDALDQIGKDLKALSVPLAPLGVDYEGHKAGELKRSAFYVVKHGPNGPYLVVGYDTPYDLVQHEELDYEHPRGGQAKYLEQPYLENKRRYSKMIKDRQRRLLRRR